MCLVKSEIKITASEAFLALFRVDEKTINPKLNTFTSISIEEPVIKRYKIIVLLKLLEIRLIFHLVYTFSWLLFWPFVSCIGIGQKHAQKWTEKGETQTMIRGLNLPFFASLFIDNLIIY